PRAVGRDDRSARRALAPTHPRGVGLRRRGRPDARRLVPAAVPRLAVLVGLPRVPRARGSGEARRPARAASHRCEAHRGVPARARAEHLRDHRPPPRGQVLHRLTYFLARHWVVREATFCWSDFVSSARSAACGSSPAWAMIAAITGSRTRRVAMQSPVAAGSPAPTIW